VGLGTAEADLGPGVLKHGYPKHTLDEKEATLTVWLVRGETGEAPPTCWRDEDCCLHAPTPAARDAAPPILRPQQTAARQAWRAPRLAESALGGGVCGRSRRNRAAVGKAASALAGTRGHARVVAGPQPMMVGQWVSSMVALERDGAPSATSYLSTRRSGPHNLPA
jgi:hypothetical protein